MGFYTHKHTPLQRGFDTFYGFWGGGEDYTTHISGGGFDFRDGEAVHRQAKGAYSTELFAARAVRLIEQHSVDTNRPLFLYLAFQATHAPLQAPPRYVERCAHVPNATKEQQDRRMFCAMAVAMDEGVQNITLALKRANMYNNSVIFFTGGKHKPRVPRLHTVWPSVLTLTPNEPCPRLLAPSPHPGCHCTHAQQTMAARCTRGATTGRCVAGRAVTSRAAYGRLRLCTRRCCPLGNGTRGVGSCT